MKKKKLVKVDKGIVNIILVVIWLGLIYFFSSQMSDESNNTSSFVIDVMNDFLKLFNQKIDIYQIPNIVFIIRKLAHFSIYLVLGILVCNLFYNYKLQKYILISVVFCFVYSICDEIHQYFVPGRFMSFIDVLLDTSGSVLGIFIFDLLVCKWHKIVL